MKANMESNSARTGPAHASPPVLGERLRPLALALLPACMVMYAVAVYALNGRADARDLALTVVAVIMAGAALLVMVALDRWHPAARALARVHGELAWLRRRDAATAAALEQVTGRQQKTESHLAWLQGRIDGPGEAFRQQGPDDRQVSGQLADIAARLDQLMAPADGERGGEMLVYLGRRVHSLVSRMLSHLNVTERKYEDPDLLDELYVLDHLATQMRRGAERMAVLGGSVARRFKTPMPVSTVLREAMAAVEQYRRVRLTLPARDMLVLGHAGPY
ncbi:hypothetical protein ACGFJT_42125 [Actinomadura geliboluensis]|uniref:hypothetical protein n=1 Tax=Actinomadura geliboluensis TaxID=882440 RepID=UPI00371B4388